VSDSSAPTLTCLFSTNPKTMPQFDRNARLKLYLNPLHFAMLIQRQQEHLPQENILRLMLKYTFRSKYKQLTVLPISNL